MKAGKWSPKGGAKAIGRSAWGWIGVPGTVWFGIAIGSLGGGSGGRLGFAVGKKSGAATQEVAAESDVGMAKAVVKKGDSWLEMVIRTGCAGGK